MYYPTRQGGFDDEARREVPLQGDEIPSDVDSDGDPPPADGKFIDPMNLEDIVQPPPRTNQEIKLPHFQPKERPRLREMFEPKVGYEEWVAGEIVEDRGTGGTRKKEVKKLEEDSDLPVGRPYFWHAFCRHCAMTYHPHVPGQWGCPVCRRKVWQQPDEQESGNCAICKQGISTIRYIKGHKLRNPALNNNPHTCKRCGRIVCDRCYSGDPHPVEEFGFTEPQKVCKTCVVDIQKFSMAPEEEDLGTLHEAQGVGNNEETLFYLPYWNPKCTRCNITFGKPPKKWKCPSCRQEVWQPEQSDESRKCWICSAAFPKTRCHKCGQLACQPCGAYAQPIPELGFEDGIGRSVCKVCYGGVSVRPKDVTATVEDEFRPTAWPPECPVCKRSEGKEPPKEWLNQCHRRKAWQPGDSKGSTKCAICAIAQTEGTRENCNMCGRLVCLGCSQYKQPVPERGFAKATSMTVCRGCFNPKMALRPDHTDFPFWPPHCTRCNKTWQTPPDRWKCPTCQDLVWQPSNRDATVASQACFTCGKKLVAGAVNCRCCGRVVCATCSSTKAEVVDRGFVRGQLYQVCTICAKRKAEEAATKAEERRLQDIEEARLMANMSMTLPAAANASFTGLPAGRPPAQAAPSGKGGVPPGAGGKSLVKSPAPAGAPGSKSSMVRPAPAKK